jgi:methionyl-tRNA synthetase
MVGRYFDGRIPEANELTEADERVLSVARAAASTADDAIERLAIHESLAAVWTLVDELNGYITSQEPWALAKKDEDRARLETVLHTAVRGLGTLAVLLAPVLPGATAKLWTALGGTGTVGQQRIDLADEWTGSGTVTPLEAPLYPRIEQEPATPAA